MRKNVLVLACISILSFTSCTSQKKTQDYTAYLFAYFEGSGELTAQEQLRFAVSADAVHWKALNGNRPVIPSDGISQTGAYFPNKQMKVHTPFLPAKRKPHGLSPNGTLHVPATFHVVFTPFSDT